MPGIMSNLGAGLSSGMTQSEIDQLVGGAGNEYDRGVKMYGQDFVDYFNQGKKGNKKYDAIIGAAPDYVNKNYNDIVNTNEYNTGVNALNSAKTADLGKYDITADQLGRRLLGNAAGRGLGISAASGGAMSGDIANAGAVSAAQRNALEQSYKDLGSNWNTQYQTNSLNQDALRARISATQRALNSGGADLADYLGMGAAYAGALI